MEFDPEEEELGDAHLDVERGGVDLGGSKAGWHALAVSGDERVEGVPGGREEAEAEEKEVSDLDVTVRGLGCHVSDEGLEGGELWQPVVVRVHLGRVVWVGEGVGSEPDDAVWELGDGVADVGGDVDVPAVELDGV